MTLRGCWSAVDLLLAGAFVAVEQNEVYRAIGKQLHIDGGTEEDKMRVIRLQVRAVL